MRRLLALLTIATLLAACRAPQTMATWQQVCLESHSEFSHFIMISTGKTTIPVAQYHTVCDIEVWRCVPGSDGSTECGDTR